MSTSVSTNQFVSESTSSSVISTGPLPSVSNVEAANVTLLGYPGEIAVDANTDRIYVSDLFANKLTVVDSSTHDVVGVITLPATANFGMAVDSNSNRIYVPVQGCTNEANVPNSCVLGPSTAGKGAIVEISGYNDSIVGVFPIDAERLAADSSTGILYAAAGSDLLAINADSGSIVANMSLNAYPLSVVVDAKTDRVYVGASKQLVLACEGAEILAFNGAQHNLEFTVPLNIDALNFNIVVDQLTDMVYTMGLRTNLTLFSIDGASGAIQYSSAIAESCADGGGGTLTVDPSSNQIYVTFDSQSFFLAANAATGHVDNMLSSPSAQSVAVSPDGTQVYLTTEGQNQTIGYLVVLPTATGESYVNNSLLPTGICLP